MGSARGPTCSISSHMSLDAETGAPGKQAQEGQGDFAEEAQHRRRAADEFHGGRPHAREKISIPPAAAGHFLLGHREGHRQQAPDAVGQPILVDLNAPGSTGPEHARQKREQSGIPGAQRSCVKFQSAHCRHA
jgi:hypothetical protein